MDQKYIVHPKCPISFFATNIKSWNIWFQKYIHSSTIDCLWNPLLKRNYI